MTDTPDWTGWEEAGYIDAEAPPPPFAAPDPYPAFIQRFICGIDPADIDDTEVIVAWGDSQPLIQIPTSLRVTTLEDDIVDLLFGGGVIPLCSRTIPAKGTE